MRIFAIPLRSLPLLFAALCIAPNYARSATITAASCSDTHVRAAISAAADGDTVQIPNGSCTWTSGISTAKQITLTGASPTGVTITHGAGGAALLTFTVGSSYRTQIANLRFMPGTGTGYYIYLNGESSGRVPLMHDVYFNIPDWQLKQAVLWHVTGGVIWRTTFESTAPGGSSSGCLEIKGWSEWMNSSTLGILDADGTDNLYIEDSTFNNVGQCPDVDSLARVVVRHSRFIGSSGLTHGLTSGGSGGRQIELYDNSFSYPDPNRNITRYFWIRAGTAVITRNSVQKIQGPMMGSQPSFQFIVENARRNDLGACCTSYPCTQQPGSGGNGTSQITDPVYIWDNTGTGAGTPDLTSTNDAPDSCGNGYTTADFFKPGRDFVVNNGPKPGYVSYPYPHPLRDGASAGKLPSPANLRVM
jgi:hypothetical protein